MKNLRLENVLVKGAENVGGLAGVLSGRIDNSYVTGQVIGTRKYYSKGGLVGRIESGSRITDSYATTKVSGLYHVGGLVGKSYLGSTIQSSYATGTVSGKGSTSSARKWNRRFGGSPLWHDPKQLCNRQCFRAGLHRRLSGP